MQVYAKATSVFVSHATSDQTFASILVNKLREAALNPWVDNERILAGDDILNSIGEGLKTTDIVIFVVSSASLRSRWVQREIAYASTREIRDKEVLVLPFVIDDTPFDELPWELTSKNVQRVSCDSRGADSVVASIKRVLQRRVVQHRSATNVNKFQGDPRVEEVIRSVSLGDWEGAELAAIEVLRRTDRNGRNEVFEALLQYQDVGDDDKLWPALNTAECCVRFAPWLISHEQIARMAAHSNFAVRSSAASICMELANVAPDRVPIDIALRLSKFDEDWYVQSPANAALKTMVHINPSVLRIYYSRLRSGDRDEREHAAHAIWEVAGKEPEHVEFDDLRKSLLFVRETGDKNSIDYLEKAAAFVKSAAKRDSGSIKYRYGL